MNKFFMLFCIILIFLSCDNKRNRIVNFQMLTNAIESNANNANTLLDSLVKTGCVYSKEDVLTYNLLNISAKDLKDQSINKDLNQILEGIRYFKHINAQQKLKVAYYYAGRIEADKYHAPEALSYFQKALDIEIQNPGLDNRICSQIGDLLFYQDLYVYAIKMYKKAYQFAKEDKNNQKISMALRDAALVYLEEGETMLALSTLKKARFYATKEKDYRLIKSINGYTISALCDLKKYEEVKLYLKDFTKHTNSSDSSAIFLIAANAYSHINKDSAAFYYSFLIKDGSDYSKERAYLFFLQKSLKDNKVEQAKFYLENYISETDKIRMNTNSEMLAKVKGLYDYQQKEEEIIKVRNNNRKWQLIGITIITCLSIVIIMFISYIQYTKLKNRNIRLQEQQLKRLQSENLTRKIEQIKTNHIHIQELEKELSILQGEKAELRKKLEEECEKIKSTNILNKIEIKEKGRLLEKMKESIIYKRIDNIIKSDQIIHLTRNERNELITTFDEIMPDYKQALYSIYEMSNREIMVCLLIKLNLKPANIAMLLGCTPSAISQVRIRLYKKVFKKKGTAEDWDKFIISL